MFLFSFLLFSFFFFSFSFIANASEEPSVEPKIRRSNRNKLDKSTAAKTAIEFDYLGIDKKYGRKTKQPITKTSENEILVQVETRPTEVISVSDQNNAAASTDQKTAGDSHTGEVSPKMVRENSPNKSITNQAIDSNASHSNDHGSHTENVVRMGNTVSITSNQATKKIDQLSVNGQQPNVPTTMSVDIRSGDALNYAMATHATDVLNGSRFNQKYRSNFETMSHQQLDPSLIELLSMREAINSMGDSNVEITPNSYVANSLNFDNVHQSRGTVNMPINAQNNIDYYNQSFGSFPYVYPNSLGSVLSDGYYLDSLVEERRRRNSTMENYSTERPTIRHN